MLKYARPTLPEPNGSQLPLCARVSQAPSWSCSQLTALSVAKSASLWDMGSSRVGGLSPPLPHSFSYFHICVAILIRNHIGHLERSETGPGSPPLRLSGLMTGGHGGAWRQPARKAGSGSGPGLLITSVFVILPLPFSVQKSEGDF